MVIDGRRDTLIFERQQAEDRLHRASGRQGMSDHRFVGRDRNVADVLAEHCGDAQMLHLVVLGRRSAVRIDVVNVLGPDPGISQGVAHTSDDWLAIWT